MICHVCGFENLPGMRFCGSCGTRLTVECPNCSFANPIQYRFCGMCGTPLISGDVNAVLPPHQPPAEVEASLSPIQLTPIEGERRDVTVLLSDLTDSTHLLEKVGTESWVELMNRALDEAALPGDATQILRAFFDEAATFMINSESSSEQRA